MTLKIANTSTYQLEMACGCPRGSTASCGTAKKNF
jgi:hypothetical protein